MMVSSMVVKSFSIKKMMITMKSWCMDDRDFARLMGEVYKQKFTKAVTISEDEDDEDN